MGSSYCWQQNDTTSFCADTVPPELLADDLVAVGPSQALEVRGDAEQVRIAVLGYPLEPYERVGRVDLQDGNGTLPETPGRYVIEVSASWPQGDRSFYLGIEVGDDTDDAPVSPDPEPLGSIEVATPAAGDTVTSPVTIAGTADVFEATVSIQILDATNNVIADTYATATCGSGCRGDFSIDVPFSVGSPQRGVIRVFEVSAENGKAMNVVRIPVTLAPGVDPVAEAVEGTWQDADGTPLPDGTDAADDFALVIHTLEGPDHCGWTSVTFLHLGWPLGTRTEPPGDFRQYLRDPQGVLRERLVTPFGADGAFPADAEPTGFHRGGWELWTAPSDVDEAVYVVEGDPRAGGTWERWPRTTEIVACD
jgi:hypothetical protein